MITEAKLKEAKNKLKIEILRVKMALGRDWTNGVGVSWDSNDNYVLKVNLLSETDAHLIPENIDGIPVVFQIIGEIRAL